MSETTAKREEARILCVLTSPKEDGQPFGVSVYAVGTDGPHRVLEATSMRSEISDFLDLMQEGSRSIQQSGSVLDAEFLATAGQ